MILQGLPVCVFDYVVGDFLTVPEIYSLTFLNKHFGKLDLTKKVYNKYISSFEGMVFNIEAHLSRNCSVFELFKLDMIMRALSRTFEHLLRSCNFDLYTYSFDNLGGVEIKTKECKVRAYTKGGFPYYCVVTSFEFCVNMDNNDIDERIRKLIMNYEASKVILFTTKIYTDLSSFLYNYHTHEITNISLCNTCLINRIRKIGFIVSKCSSGNKLIVTKWDRFLPYEEQPEVFCKDCS